MLSCAQTRDRFSDRLDDRLPSADAASVALHLDGCAACRREWQAYHADFAALGSFLERSVGERAPERPFPRLRRPRLAGLTHATLAAAALASLLLLTRPPGPVGGLEPVRTELASTVRASTPSESCPWRDRRPGEVSRLISYPVVTHECLEHDFELVQASVRDGEDCDENVRLTYRSGSRQLIVEQGPETAPSCCAGEHVLVGDHLGCVESNEQRTKLSWSQHHHLFQLSGDVPLAEAVQAAARISESFGE